MQTDVTLAMIREAREAMRGVVQKTPIVSSSRVLGGLLIKSENLQRTGSFKIRGAFNKIRLLSDEQKQRGVIAASAGNHAQGVALSATQFHIPSVICMPEGAPVQKVEATKGYGAEVVLVPGVYDDAAKEALRLSEEKGYTFAHPFNDPHVIAGQGTIALEILADIPDVEQILVPIGGGGLISGIAVAIKAVNPNIRVIGVQAASVPSMFVSREQGHVSTVPDGATIADGIHVLTPGDLTFSLVQEYVDDIVTVTEDEIAEAIVSLIEGPKTVAEGAGAVSVAAYLSRKIDTEKRTVAVVSGGNVDVNMLSRILTRGLLKTGRIVTVHTTLPDRSGNLVKLLQVVGTSGANILNITHEREDLKSDANSCAVTLTLETLNHDHINTILADMKRAGYAPTL